MIKKEYIDELQDCFTKLPCPSNNRDPFNRFFNEDLGALKSARARARKGARSPGTACCTHSGCSSCRAACDRALRPRHPVPQRRHVPQPYQRVLLRALVQRRAVRNPRAPDMPAVTEQHEDGLPAVGGAPRVRVCPKLLRATWAAPNTIR